MAEGAATEDEVKKIAEKVIRGLDPASTDREAVIVSAAFMSDGLRSCLENFLVDNKVVQSRMFDPSQNGALSNFAPMADMAYLLGMIPDEIRKWLKLMANVRNIFAHRWLVASFEDLSKTDDKDVQRTLEKLEHFVPSSLREDVHPLRQAYEILYTCLICGLHPLTKREAIEHLPEKKFAFEVGDGEQDWEALVRNYFLENPAIYEQVNAQIQSKATNT